MIGRFLSALYHEPIDNGDASVESPESAAASWMRTLAKERLGLELPSDIDGMREWWRQNQIQFAAKAEPDQKRLQLATAAPSGKANEMRGKFDAMMERRTCIISIGFSGVDCNCGLRRMGP